MSSIAAFPQPLYAKTKGGDQVIVLAVIDGPDDGTLYLVMFNDVGHTNHGKSTYMAMRDVIFEHFYWPEIEPADSITDFEHPQEPALKVW